MTRVVFYTGVGDKAAFVRRFLESKVLSRRQTALVYGGEALMARLDDDLWREGFVPHARAGGEMARDTPVLLTSEAPPPDYAADVLISLSSSPPSFAGRFPVFIDIVGGGEEDKREGRKRYRYFKDHGYPIAAHAMR